jgi:hypothetical protein
MVNKFHLDNIGKKTKKNLKYVYGQKLGQHPPIKEKEMKELKKERKKERKKEGKKEREK